MSHELSAVAYYSDMDSGTPKTLIVCASVHHHNTARVASAMAAVLHADIVAPEDAAADRWGDYDLLGLGSGIYYGQVHATIRAWAERLPPGGGRGRRAFLFTTSGLPLLWPVWHWPLRRLLVAKGFTLVGEFHCGGFDTWGPLWITGGINRRHPDDRDLARAAAFARGLALSETAC